MISFILFPLTLGAKFEFYYIENGLLNSLSTLMLFGKRYQGGQVENGCITGVVQEGLSLSTPSSIQYTCIFEGLVNMIVFNMNDYIPKKNKNVMKEKGGKNY